MRSSGAKQLIERAATELFAARGIDGVSIAEIAALAGVSQGALYRHYASKEELAWSLFSTAYLRTGAELDAIRAQQPAFPARLAAMVAHFCAFYDNDPALFRFMLIAQQDRCRALAAASGRRSMRLLTQSRMRFMPAKSLSPSRPSRLPSSSASCCKPPFSISMDGCRVRFRRVRRN